MGRRAEKGKTEAPPCKRTTLSLPPKKKKKKRAEKTTNITLPERKGERELGAPPTVHKTPFLPSPIRDPETRRKKHLYFSQHFCESANERTLHPPKNKRPRKKSCCIFLQTPTKKSPPCRQTVRAPWFHTQKTVAVVIFAPEQKKPVNWESWEIVRAESPLPVGPLGAAARQESF